MDRKPRKYQDMGGMAGFGFFANAIQDGGGGDGDCGQGFPRSDAEDFSAGARFIPSEVTEARRKGEPVEFVQDCNSPVCWYWKFKDGIRIYHWDHGFENLETCPRCGNKHVKGGTIKDYAT